jgi:hypothetical protein
VSLNFSFYLRRKQVARFRKNVSPEADQGLRSIRAASGIPQTESSGLTDIPPSGWRIEAFQVLAWSCGFSK